MLTINPRQFIASIILSVSLLILIVRLVQKGRLDIAYCWVWLGIGAGSILVVVRYDWLVRLSHLIGAVTITTTLFLIAFFVLLLMTLQFSLVISQHRRQIKKLSQEIALLRGEHPPADEAASPSTDTPAAGTFDSSSLQPPSLWRSATVRSPGQPTRSLRSDWPASPPVRGMRVLQ